MGEEMDIIELRNNIDKIDNNILQLLINRMEVVQKIGQLKQKNQTNIYHPAREKQILDRLNTINKQQNSLLEQKALEAIYMEIFAISRNLELPQRIAYLGPIGSYTHQVAESRFGGISNYLSMNNISSVFKTVESKRAKYGVVPIENNRNGVVGETLDNLATTSLKIIAEVILPIHHVFASMAESLDKIKCIYSKDIAFGQCYNFLNEHNLEDVQRIPTDSTSRAAQLASNNVQSGAICSHIAANIHALPILFESIEDIAHNKTRFIIISDFKNIPSGNDKTSICVDLKNTNKPGVLVNFLRDIESLGLNMSKIESRPKSGNNGFEFHFFIDIDGHVDDESLQILTNKHKESIKWLGSYISTQ